MPVSTPALRRWTLLALLALVFVTVLNTMSRWFIWDEATYFSQSGNLPGGVGDTAYFSPSRELGTPGLVWLIRAVTPDGITTVRVGWAVVSILLAVVAFRAVGRIGPRWSGEIGFGLYVTYWITTGYATSIFGSLLGGLFALWATAVYIRLQRDDGNPLVLGALLGAALAGMWWMRSVESALVTAVLVGHVVLWRRADLLRRHARAFAVTVGAYVLLFVIPWMIHSQVVYGSPVGHLSAWVSRRQRRTSEFAAKVHDGVPDWLRLLFGDSYLGHHSPPLWTKIVIGVGFLALLAGTVAALVRRGRLVRRSSLGLLTTMAAVSFGFFFFYVVPLNDRYALYGWAFSAAIGGILVASGVRRFRRDPRVLLGVAAAIALWVAANAYVSHATDDERLARVEPDRTTVQLLKEAAAQGPCQVLLPTPVRPAIEVASPCEVHSGVPDAYPDRLQRIASSDETTYALWQRSFGAVPDPADWSLVKRFRPFLLYRAVR